MPSRDRPPASTVPAASASASRARWAAEGFSSPCGSAGHASWKRRKASASALQMPGEPVGRAVAGGGLDGPGVVGEQARAVRPRRRSRSAGRGAGVPRAQVVGVAQQGPGAGVGVADPEQRVALALGQVRRRVDAGPVVGGRAQQGPAGGVGAEACAAARGSGGLGRGRAERRRRRGRPAADAGAPACEPAVTASATQAPARDLAGGRELRRPPGEGVAVPVPAPLRPDDLDARALVRTPPLEGDVEEPGPGDVDAGRCPARRRACGRRTSATARAARAGRAGRAGGRRSWRSPRTRAAAGRCTTTRSGTADAQLVGLDGTTHRVQHGAGELGGGHGHKRRRGGGCGRERVSSCPVDALVTLGLRPVPPARRGGPDGRRAPARPSTSPAARPLTARSRLEGLGEEGVDPGGDARARPRTAVQALTIDDRQMPASAGSDRSRAAVRSPSSRGMTTSRVTTSGRT